MSFSEETKAIYSTELYRKYLTEILCEGSKVM